MTMKHEYSCRLILPVTTRCDGYFNPDIELYIYIFTLLSKMLYFLKVIPAKIGLHFCCH